MELFNGIMAKNFKEIGKKAWNVVLVYGDLQKEIAIKENGWITGNMVKEFLSTVIVHIKVNFKIS
jgi:hypothetical protein